MNFFSASKARLKLTLIGQELEDVDQMLDEASPGEGYDALLKTRSDLVAHSSELIDKLVEAGYTPAEWFMPRHEVLAWVAVGLIGAWAVTCAAMALWA